MRPASSSSVAAVALLAIAGLAIAGPDVAPIREPTRIPAEPLGQALRTLAGERGFQVIYDSGQVDDRRTRGARGDLTVEEALTEVLRGTGLTFHKLSDSGIVIEPLASQTRASAPHSRVATASARASGDSAGSEQAQLGAVTIEATEERQALRRRVDQFVTAVVVRPYGENLIRWNGPVCPLVAGLSRDFGEFVLRRISQAAADARAPLAGTACHPNLYVVATNHPDALLKTWWARDKWMYNTGHGPRPVNDFVQSRQPVRVWYNTDLGCAGNAQITTGVPSYTGFGPPGVAPPICANDIPDATRLGRPIILSILSAIVVVDLRQMEKVTVRQMADYIALISLADVRQGTDSIPVSSILWLFGHERPPQGLSAWDQALLYSLYNTSQASELQVQEIEHAMVGRIKQQPIASPLGYRSSANPLIPP